MAPTPTPSDLLVGINFLIVPDGLRVDRGKTFARLSISVSPDMQPSSDAQKVDLRHWPSEIHRLLGKIRVATGKLVSAGSDYTVTSPSFIRKRFDPDVVSSAELVTEADALWQRIFKMPHQDENEAFRAMKRAFIDGSAATIRWQPTNADWRYGSYAVADVSRVIDALYSAATARALLSRSAVLADVFDGAFKSAPETTVAFWKTIRQDWLGGPGSRDFVGQLRSYPSTRAPVPEAPESDEIAREMRDFAKRLAGRLSRPVAPSTDLAEKMAVDAARDLAAAADFLLGQATDKDFWKSARASGPNVDQFKKAARKEISRFLECWNFGWHLAPRKSTDMSAENESQAPLRKYGAIQSYPTLAKFLGLIVDVEIPLQDITDASSAGEGGRSYGAIAVDVAPGGDPTTWGAPAPEKYLWSSYVYRPQSTAQPPLPAYFGPCLQQEAAELKPADRHYIREGVIDLNVELVPSVPRFALQTLDVTNGLVSILSDADEANYRDAMGLAHSRISTGLPPLRTRGIELIDRLAVQKEIREADRERTIRTRRSNGQVSIRDAEDLLQGFRIDVAVADRSGQWRDAKRWRPLMSRHVEFRTKIDGVNKYRDIPKSYLDLPGVARHAHRNDGHSRMMSGETTVQEEAPDTPIDPPSPGPNNGGAKKVQRTSHPQVFTWTGQSLGVAAASELIPGAPPNAADCRVVWPDAATDLAIDLELNLPSAPAEGKTDMRPAPLREGRAVMVGARASFVNGCSLTFETGRARYIEHNSSVALGDNKSLPFVYRRRDRIEAPDVLLFWNDRIVGKPTKEWPGETIDTIVVRTGEIKTTETSRRIAVPPRVPFDTAEQGGAFDRSSADTPAGAFAGGDYPAQLQRDTGTFPVARGGDWEFPKLTNPADCTSPVPPEPPRQPSRGSVFVLDAAAHRPNVEFYPDPLARSASGVFCHLIDGSQQPAPNFGPPSRKVQFWAANRSSSNAAPIAVVLRKATEDEQPGVRGWFDDTNKVERLRHLHGGTVDVERLTVALKPAETVDLALWSVPDAQNLLDQHEAFRSMQKVLERSVATYKSSRSVSPETVGILDAAVTSLSGSNKAQFVDGLLAAGAVPNVQTYRYLRLVHAVQAPLKDPWFVMQPGGREPQFHPVVVTVAGSDHDSALKSWAQFAEEHSANDPLEWPSQPGGTTAFFVGAIGVDRVSTGKVRCDARWREFGPESERFDAVKREWTSAPPYQYGRLFEVTDISSSDADRDHTIDLLLNDGKTNYRALSRAFLNGKARHLALALTATSRFTEFFPSVKSGPGKSPFETESSTLEESRIKVWVPATVRPAPPELDRVAPVFRWKLTGARGAKELAFSRETTLRVYLKRPWHSSGEDELLGLVCWPPELVGPSTQDGAKTSDEVVRLDVCALESQTHELNRFVTRWGADPVRLSGQLDDVISADRFSDYETAASDLVLPLTTDPVETSSFGRVRALLQSAVTAKVSVLGYRPKLDKAEGLWTCDVTVDHGPAYFPFIQLGLARYQPHAVSGLELSAPVSHVGQIPPRRSGKVTFVSDRELVVELHGVGFHRTETGGHTGDRHLTDVPLLNLRLLHATNDDAIPRNSDRTIKWQRVLDNHGNPIEKNLLRPIRKGAEVWWSWKVTLPTGRGQVDYGLLIEEIELMAADIQTGPTPAQACGDLKFDTTLQERGPLFSHIVDLRT